MPYDIVKPNKSKSRKNAPKMYPPPKGKKSLLQKKSATPVDEMGPIRGFWHKSSGRDRYVVIDQLHIYLSP